MKKMIALLLLTSILFGLSTLTPGSFADSSEEQIDSFRNPIYLTNIQHGKKFKQEWLPDTYAYTYIENGYIYHGILNRYGSKTMVYNGRLYYIGLYQGYVYYSGHTVTMMER